MIATYDDHNITITVEKIQDETDYLLSSEENRNILLKRIQAAKSGEIKHSLTLDEIEEMAK